MLVKSLNCIKMSKNKTILEVENLKVYFPLLSGFVKKITGHVRAVDGVSINLF